mmetsp:Transcript_21807/g.35029  ORF Transcript_21807/g.35029 Transcript_21807/m.35029 type:complete len:745 (-) Transcript_21807:287-2521(-)
MATRSWLDLDTSGDDTSDFEERTPPPQSAAGNNASPLTTNSTTTPQTTPSQSQPVVQPQPPSQVHPQRTLQHRQLYQPPKLQSTSPDSPQRALPRRALNKFDLRGNGLGPRKSRSIGGLPTSFRPPMQGGGASNHMKDNLAALQRLDLGNGNGMEDGNVDVNHNHNHNHNNGGNNNTENGGDGQLKRTYSYPLPDHAPFCVWLGNLPAEAKPSHIVSFLEPVGIEPKDVRFGRIHKNKYTCAYVDFYSKEDMKKALLSIDATNAPEFMGRKVEIDINEGIVVDREAAVTCTSSASSLNSPFRNNKNKRGIAHSAHHANGNGKDGGGGGGDGGADANTQDIRFSVGNGHHHEDTGVGVGGGNVAGVDDRGLLNTSHSNGNSTGSNGGGYSGDYYSDKREKYHRSKQFDSPHNGPGASPAFRGRARSGRGGDRNFVGGVGGGGVNAGYWTGQWGQYRRKSGNGNGNGGSKYGNGFSPKMNNANGNNAPANESVAPNLANMHSKPVKILQRPKHSPSTSTQTQSPPQSMAALVAQHNPQQPQQQQQQTVPNEPANLTKTASSASSIHDEVKPRKSRFPTLDEDEQRNPTVVQDYIQKEQQYHDAESNGSVNGSMKNYHMDTPSSSAAAEATAAAYYDKKANYYNKSSKRRIDNNSFNGHTQQFPQHTGYKGKRHRNNHRSNTSDDAYYTSKSSYKSSYREDRSNGRRTNYNDSRSAGSSYRGGGGAGGSGGRYSKKRHGGSNSYAAY